MSYWFPKFKVEDLTYKSLEIDNSSIIYVEKKTKLIIGFGDVDHVLGSDDLKITSENNWDFIKDAPQYPSKSNIRVGELWDIEAGYPDHAMMITDIEIIK